MIDLKQLENPAENIYVLKKWNWDYLEAEIFQLECLEYVNQNPHVSILIICSHPHSFTLGRGLQKIKETTKIDLVDFNKDSDLPFPLYQIKRGGGLTFHYPGQVVFYPILNLTFHKKAVFDLMIKIMGLTKEIIEKQLGLRDLTLNRELLGLWFDGPLEKSKIASIGLAVSRFTTYHGLALNFFHDKELFSSLKNLYPCGLPGHLYKDIELILFSPLSMQDREKFSEELLAQFTQYLKPAVDHHFMIDTQRSSSLINNSIS